MPCVSYQTGGAAARVAVGLKTAHDCQRGSGKKETKNILDKKTFWTKKHNGEYRKESVAYVLSALHVFVKYVFDTCLSYRSYKTKKQDFNICFMQSDCASLHVFYTPPALARIHVFYVLRAET